MKNKLGATLALACVLFVITLALVPVTGYCDWFSSITEIFGQKGKVMKEVATKIATLSEDEDIWGLDFSPDGKYLAATSPNTVSPSSSKVEVHIWEWKAGHIVRSLEKARGANDGLATESIRYSPDGHLLATCHSRAANNIVARIWNTGTWEIVHDIDEPVGGGGCNAVGFTTDGKSLIRVLSRMPQFSGDNLITYDISTWQPIWGLRTVPFYPNALAVSPDGKYIAVGGEVRNPRSWPFTTPVPTFGNPPLSNMPLIAVVDIAQREIVRTIQSASIDRLAWSPDGADIASGGAKGIEIFDAHTGKRVVDEATHGGHVLIRYTPDGKYLIESGLNEGGTTVRIWDGKHRGLLQEIKAMPGSMAVSHDGHYLAIGGKKKILIWELK